MNRAVAKHLQVDYEEFASRPDPFNLQGEMAQLRTLLVETREGLEDSTIAKQLEFGQVVEAMCLAQLTDVEEWDEEEARPLAAKLADIASEALGAVFGTRVRMTPKDAVDIAKVVESLSKVSERYKKMADGVVLNIKYDNELSEMMSRFVVHVIMRYIPVSKRDAVAAAARAFLPTSQSLGTTTNWSTVDLDNMVEHE